MPRPRNIIQLNKNYQKASENFYQTLVNLGYSKESCRNAQCNIEDFLYIVSQQGIKELNDITNVHLSEYQKYLNQKPNQNKGGTLSPKTIHHHFRYLNHFFNQLQEQGKINLNPFDSFTYKYPNVPDKGRTVLTQEEIQILYKQAEPGLEEALLSLAYGCGLRAGEIERLNIEDIRFKDNLLIVKRGKGNKRRVVPLAGKVSQQLEYYLNNIRLYEQEVFPLRGNGKGAFLLNFKQRRFREHNGNYLLRKLVKQSQNTELQQKEISLHVLRHSIATHLIEEGLSLEKVRDFLGHYHIETTEIYTHISQNQINKLLQNDE